MFKQRRIKPFAVIYSVLVLFACLFSACVFADPPTGNADASVCSSLLLDRDIVQGTRTFNPEDLSIYNSDIKSILEYADQIPDFGAALRKALKKKWHFEFSDYKNCPTEYSMYTSATDKVACQTPDEVSVNPHWFVSLDKDSCRNMNNADAIKALKQKQRDFFVHEMLLGITLGTPISSAASSVIFNDLTLQPRPSIEKLQMDLESSHFGVYRLGARSAAAQPAAGSGVSLQDVLNAQSVDIKTTVDGHFIYVGYWEKSFGGEDDSSTIAAQVCRKAGYSTVISFTSEKIILPNGSESDRTLYGYVNLAVFPHDTNGSIQFKDFEIWWKCTSYHGCGYARVPIALKSVRCKKNADANDVLNATNQLGSPDRTDRTASTQTGKPLRDRQSADVTRSSDVASAERAE